jgi:LysM repeat protein
MRKEQAARAAKAAAGANEPAKAMTPKEAYDYLATDKALFDAVDTGANLSPKDGYFSRDDVTQYRKVNDDTLSAEQKGCLDQIIANYDSLEKIAKADPNNPHWLPNRTALDMARGAIKEYPNPQAVVLDGPKTGQPVIDAAAAAKAAAVKANSRSADQAPVESVDEMRREQIAMRKEQAATAAAAKAAAENGQWPRQHTVVSGESLWTIAKKHYGPENASRWPVIFEANKKIIRDPALIFPGQVFEIPALKK